jgi:glutamine synthetase
MAMFRRRQWLAMLPRMALRSGYMTVEELRTAVEAGHLDTVIVALPDMQGRLAGKRFTGRFFLDEVLRHGTEACAYLLASDVDMNTVDGYDLTSWERGYGDFALRPDLGTLRAVPWEEAAALLIADVTDHHGAPVAASPRQVLARQLDRLDERGWSAMVGTELEFIVYRDSYEEAWSRRYRDLTPGNQYNVDYSVLGTGRVEPLLRRIRVAMAGAGMYVESAKGECNLGQHEIAFRFADALTTCDNHTIYKTGAKQIAADLGMSLTFMAKVDEREGNSCHIHISLRDGDDRPVLADEGGPHGLSSLGERFLAGQLACLPELTLLYAPNINSYKRYQPGSFAPTAIKWGVDNRTCALRLVGHGRSLRVESRVPGGDVNPYLAVAGLVASGLHGIERELPLEPDYAGNAYSAADARHVPATLRDALELWEGSALARTFFGDDVVEHYANNARVELTAFDAAVTDWELRRGFERM